MQSFDREVISLDCYLLDLEFVMCLAKTETVM